MWGCVVCMKTKHFLPRLFMCIHHFRLPLLLKSLWSRIYECVYFRENTSIVYYTFAGTVNIFWKWEYYQIKIRFQCSYDWMVERMDGWWWWWCVRWWRKIYFRIMVIKSVLMWSCLYQCSYESTNVCTINKRTLEKQTDREATKSWSMKFW